MGEPGVIRKLSEEVVNRIAAGEIVQRPANALKELIENSLDAKSTNIIITVKAGGLKYLQIQDNGTGIRQADLEIVCERFTTSKLQQYEDLQEINTYGFRGEALASISHIAHLTILTKTSIDKCAFKASYENGKLKGPIKACAGNNGTQITVEDLFYNVIARKKSLRSPNEEYTHIMDVVGGYAIHNSNVGFTLKKFGEKTDVKTTMKSSVIENVRIIHGNVIARELMEIELKDPTLKLSVHGYITNVNYSNKKGTMLLFINHRLVDSLAIRKAVDSIYATYLPRNSHAFVYLSIELDPKNVDVNVHPTKHEVQFLYEEQIIEKIKSCIESKLLSCNSTRVMYTQARLPGATNIEEIVKKTTDGTGSKIYANNMVRVNADAQKIDKFFPSVSRVLENVNNRTENDKTKKTDDHKVNEQHNTIDEQSTDDVEMKEDNHNETEDISNSIVEEPKETNKISNGWTIGAGQGNLSFIDPKESFKTRKFQHDRVETKLTSVKQLRLDVENSCNMNLREILANLIFIACIDCHRSLIQHSTKLYLCDTTKLTYISMSVDGYTSRGRPKKWMDCVKEYMNVRGMNSESMSDRAERKCKTLCRSHLVWDKGRRLMDDEELFYETMLYDFQNFGLIRLSNPLPLEELFVLGLSSHDSQWNPELGDMRELAAQMAELMISKRVMLLEYFSLECSSDGELLALPLLLDGHTPFMGALPTYLVRLVTEVNWDSEKACFDTFSRQTAIFYSQPNPDSSPTVQKSEEWKQEHIIFPAVRRNFLPPTSFVNSGAILQIASLNDLYKVFERC